MTLDCESVQKSEYFYADAFICCKLVFPVSFLDHVFFRGRKCYIVVSHASLKEVVRVENGCIKLRNLTLETGVTRVLCVVRLRQQKLLKPGRYPNSG